MSVERGAICEQHVRAAQGVQGPVRVALLHAEGRERRGAGPARSMPHVELEHVLQRHGIEAQARVGHEARVQQQLAVLLAGAQRADRLEPAQGIERQRDRRTARIDADRAVEVEPLQVGAGEGARVVAAEDDAEADGLDHRDQQGQRGPGAEARTQALERHGRRPAQPGRHRDQVPNVVVLVGQEEGAPEQGEPGGGDAGSRTKRGEQPQQGEQQQDRVVARERLREAREGRAGELEHHRLAADRDGGVVGEVLACCHGLGRGGAVAHQVRVPDREGEDEEAQRRAQPEGQALPQLASAPAPGGRRPGEGRDQDRERSSLVRAEGERCANAAQQERPPRARARVHAASGHGEGGEGGERSPGALVQAEVDQEQARRAKGPAEPRAGPQPRGAEAQHEDHGEQRGQQGQHAARQEVRALGVLLEDRRVLAGPAPLAGRAPHGVLGGEAGDEGVREEVRVGAPASDRRHGVAVVGHAQGRAHHVRVRDVVVGRAVVDREEAQGCSQQEQDQQPHAGRRPRRLARLLLAHRPRPPGPRGPGPRSVGPRSVGPLRGTAKGPPGTPGPDPPYRLCKGTPQAALPG